MAITENDSVSTTTKAPAAFTQAPQQNSVIPKNWSFHGGALNASPIGRSMGSEVLKKLQKALGDIYKDMTSDVEVVLIPLDKEQETALAFSSLLVAARFKRAGNPGVGFYNLILEATGDKPSPIFETTNSGMGQQQIEIVRVAGDAYDDVLRSKASAAIARAFPNVSQFSAEACVVPTSFNVDNAAAVHQLAVNAVIAATTELQTNFKGFEDLDLTKFAKDSNLEVRVAFSKSQNEDAVGQAVRSDVTMEFVSQQQQNNQNRSLNNGDRATKIASLSGFVDILYAPVAPQATYNPWGNAPGTTPTNKQLYAARLVLTDSTTEFASTPAGQLLGLTAAMSLQQDNNWIQAFRPVASSGGDIDMNDIGGLGIEANFENNPNGIGSKVAVKSDAFRPEDLGQYIGALFRPGLVLSMDVPECGPQSWYTNIFAAASAGDANAYHALRNAANTLTGGTFDKFFPQNAPMFVDSGNRVHLGYYEDRMGQKRDIRDIDYLAVVNVLGEKDHASIRDWSDTFTQTGYSLAMRLAARKRIITALTGQSAVFTGFAQRVTFTPEFINALTQACHATGLMVRVNTPMNASQFNNQRGVAQFVGNSMINNGSQMFTQGPVFGANPQMNSGAGFYSRWRG